MLTQEDLTERYVFGGYIKRGDDTVLDIAVEAIDTPESISKAMNTVHRAMTNYAPKPIVISADKAQSDHAPAQTAALIAEQAVAASEPATAANPATLERKPTPAPVPPPKPDRPLEGVRGMIHLRCEGCGKTLATSLKMKQQEITCRCGHTIDLTKPLARFRYTCPYCEMERWGLTNLEDSNICIKCKCGGTVDLQWESKAKEYRN